MKIILISEKYDYHFVGGIFTYVEVVCKGLDAASHQVDLIVPNHKDSQNKIIEKSPNWRIHYLKLNSDTKNKFRGVWFQFVASVNNYLPQLIDKIHPDIVHVLFGMFLIGGLEIEYLTVPCCVTIHNLPPRECSRTWVGDLPWRYLTEQTRLKLVQWLNYSRLRQHRYDAYIPISYRVFQLLSQSISDVKIVPIEHGIFPPDIVMSAHKNTGNICNLLTVAGYVPHKGQHLALQVAAHLRRCGFEFTWTMIGPVRIPKYYQYLEHKIKELGLSNQITLKVNASNQELEDAYRNNNIYVQPSLEEGFCFTALEAALHKLPVIGTNEGAIPEIIRRGQGILVEPCISSLVEAIVKIWSSQTEYSYTDEQFTAIRNHYSWQRMHSELVELYTNLISNS